MWYWRGKMPEVNSTFTLDGTTYFAQSQKSGDIHICEVGNEYMWTVVIIDGKTGKLTWMRDHRKKTKRLLDAKFEQTKKGKPVPITNRKWLSRMSDEELAQRISGYESEICDMDAEEICSWLKKEHTEI